MSRASNAEGNDERNVFALRVLGAIREAGETRELTYDAEQFCIQPLDEPWPLLNLVNVYKEFTAAGCEQRDQVVRNVVRNWFADRCKMPEDYGDLHPDLLPSVRSRSYFEFTRLQLLAAGHAPLSWAHEVIGEHLALGLVFDLPEMMQLIGEDDLAQWKVSCDQALIDAKRNLRALGDHPFICPAKGVYLSASHDNYDASRMVLHDVIEQLPVLGEPIAAVPNRDLLIITGSEDPDGIALLTNVLAETLSAPRPISGFVFRLVDDAWRPWLPPTQHPSFRKLKLLRLRALGQKYAEQKSLLDDWHAQSGDGTFVGNFAAAENPETGDLASYCVWTAGAEILLPETDAIYFFQPDASTQSGEVIATGSWAKVAEIVGELLEKLDHYPPRYRVREFPTPSQLARIGRLN